MGLFNGYLKPGPGVDKDAPKKKGLFLLIEIFIRKFIKIMQLNLMYVLFSLPWLLILYVFSMFVTNDLANSVANISIQQIPGQDFASVLGVAQVSLRLLFVLLVFCLWGSGPASAGYAYITRCFTREEHAWVWSDFVDKFKGNFKQGMAVVCIDAVMLFLGCNALYFYVSIYQMTGSFMWLLLCYVCILLFVVYSMMHYFIYQIMVTFECKLSQLYRNALLLSLGKAPMCLLLTGIGVALIYMMTINPIIGVLLSVFLGISIIRFPMEFYTARVIEKTAVNIRKKPISLKEEL